MPIFNHTIIIYALCPSALGGVYVIWRFAEAGL